jgi:hypothetical protein
MKDDIIELLGDDSNALFADGFDEAIIGVELDADRVVYDKNEMINILVRDGMDTIDAIEHLSYNVWGAYVGVHTPIYIDTIQVSTN